ncbi:MAG: 16S rRNA (cytosine(1402)-N(4))-methyltransferase RsmH [Proteobacteria bacterium]|nr:16S rRNA (cytosine(1402)-N(4))-methyltransferase RsmH [Pseudomonadota bacterium]
MTTVAAQQHKPVMLDEALEGLNIVPDGVYIDGTFGRGGHSQAILKRLSPQGRLLCFDKDPQAVAFGKDQFNEDKRVTFYHACFSDMYRIAKDHHFDKRVNGILLDLGVSSPQLDEAERGFSFMREGPLDMRMDPLSGISAAKWLNAASSEDIIYVLRKYGEESFAKKITRNIIEARSKKPITTTLELANIVAKSVPYRKIGQHPATKTFQAIRIYINQELQAIDQLLNDAWELLAPLGRLAIISFHSLEDRKVKQFFREHSRVSVPKGLAIPEKELISPFEWIVKRQRPSMDEVGQNLRARSATLRVAQKRL